MMAILYPYSVVVIAQLFVRKSTILQLHKSPIPHLFCSANPQIYDLFKSVIPQVRTSASQQCRKPPISQLFLSTQFRYFLQFRNFPIFYKFAIPQFFNFIYIRTSATFYKSAISCRTSFHNFYIFKISTY